MHTLEIEIDGKKDVRHSESQQSLIRDVTVLFQLGIDSEIKVLPWYAEINERGQVVLLEFDSEWDDGYWRQFLVHPGQMSRVEATIRKVGGEEILGSYDLPDHLSDGKNGKAWAAIKDGAVVDLVYMRVATEDQFKAHRSNAFKRLQPQGMIKEGTVSSKMFVPRRGRPLRDRK